MNKHSLSKKHTQDAWIWKTVGVTFFVKWEGNPLNFLKHYDYNARVILDEMKKSTHPQNGKEVWDYPFLRGDKIGPLWIKMLRDDIGINEFKKLDEVPVPVDIHVARSSLALGLVRGKFEGRLVDLFENIRQAWFQGVKNVSIKDRPMIALDVDEPLWHLSKYGCSSRDKISGQCPVQHLCEARQLCVSGRIMIEKERVEMNT